MSAARISKFQWDRLLSKVGPADARSLNMLRAQANELQSNHAKVSAEPAKLDFGGYKSKLRFTGAAVDALEVWCIIIY